MLVVERSSPAHTFCQLIHSLPGGFIPPGIHNSPWMSTGMAILGSTLRLLTGFSFFLPPGFSQMPFLRFSLAGFSHQLR